MIYDTYFENRENCSVQIVDKKTGDKAVQSEAELQTSKSFEVKSLRVVHLCLRMNLEITKVNSVDYPGEIQDVITWKLAGIQFLG